MENGGPSRDGRGRDRNRIHHFRFKPNPEFHTELMNLVDERHNAIGEDLFTDDPIAESRAIMASSSKPPVVNHK